MVTQVGTPVYSAAEVLQVGIDDGGSKSDSYNGSACSIQRSIYKKC